MLAMPTRLPAARHSSCLGSPQLPQEEVCPNTSTRKRVISAKYKTWMALFLLVGLSLFAHNRFCACGCSLVFFLLFCQEAIEGEKVPGSTLTGLEKKQGERGEGEEEKDDVKSPPPGDMVLAPPVDTADVQLQLQPASSPQSAGPPGDLAAPESDEGAGAGAEEAPPCPLPRINPCLTVRGNTLYVYGGLLEVCRRGERGKGRCYVLVTTTMMAAAGCCFPTRRRVVD